MVQQFQAMVQSCGIAFLEMNLLLTIEMLPAYMIKNLLEIVLRNYSREEVASKLHPISIARSVKFEAQDLV